jgi:Do/DeqQ family serine protease
VTVVRRFSVVVAVLVGFLAGMVLTGRLRSAEPPAESRYPSQSVALPQAQLVAQQAPASATLPPAAALPDFTTVAAQAVKAVTNISSLQYVQRQNSPFANDPFFQYFFGSGDMFGERSRRELSLGSGVVVSADGYVLTNNHVVGQQGRGSVVTVALGDKREVRAQVVGLDDATDIALLKLDLRHLPVIPWGDSSRLKVAEWVLAVGNPFQLSQTVTLGIVSALGRANIGAAAYEDFIQTDAAINPGNSGGALINRRGELVGINTWIYSQSGGDQGIGFAIPSNIARRVADELIRTGEVKRGTIGEIRLATITPELARDLSLTDTKGALVWSLYRTTSAYRAGLRPGDVIVAVDGKPVALPAQFQRTLLDSPIGHVLTLAILREGARRDIKVQVEQQVSRARGVAE